MKQKENQYEPVTSFKELRAEMLLDTVKSEILYEQAFFSTQEKSRTEYAQNTTTWD